MGRKGKPNAMRFIKFGIRQFPMPGRDMETDNRVNMIPSMMALTTQEKTLRSLSKYADHTLRKCDRKQPDELASEWNLWRSVYAELDKARYLFASLRPDDAVIGIFKVCRIFNGSIQKILPNSIPDLVSCIMMLQEPDLAESSATVLRWFIGATWMVKKTFEHPCYLLLNFLASSHTNLKQAASQVLEVWTDVMAAARKDEPQNNNAINAMIAIADARERCGDTLICQRIYHEEILSARIHHGPDSDIERNLWGQLAGNALQRGDHEEVKGISNTCLDMCQRRNYHYTPCQYCLHYRTLLGWAAKSRGDLYSAAAIFGEILYSENIQPVCRAGETLSIYKELIDIHTRLDQIALLNMLVLAFADHAAALEHHEDRRLAGLDIVRLQNGGGDGEADVEFFQQTTALLSSLYQDPCATRTPCY